MWFSCEYLPFARQLDQLAESFRERCLQFQRISGLSTSAATKSQPNKVGLISFDPLNMTELALQLKGLKAELEPYMQALRSKMSLTRISWSAPLSCIQLSNPLSRSEVTLKRPPRTSLSLFKITKMTLHKRFSAISTKMNLHQRWCVMSKCLKFLSRRGFARQCPPPPSQPPPPPPLSPLSARANTAQWQ